MDRCVACGAELGVGRFCLNCGHPVGQPAPMPAAPPVAVPVQAADPTPVSPTTPPTPAPRSSEESSEESSESETSEPSEPETSQRSASQRRTPAVASAAAAARSALSRSRAPRTASSWDPQVDLLPYHEVDDAEDDAVVHGPSSLIWVAAAVLLVGLVVVLIEVFGTDGEDVTAGDDTTSGEVSPSDPGEPSDGSGEETPATDAPTGVGKRFDLATGATFTVPDTAPPTQDFDGNLVAYEASQMHDGNPTTTWRMAGDATGQSITIALAEPGVVYRVGLINGYAKQVAGVDWYPNNRRILAVTWGFEDGTSVEQTFAERPKMQFLKVPPVQTATVTITLTSVTSPGSGNLGRDYTAISEVKVIGRAAG